MLGLNSIRLEACLVSNSKAPVLSRDRRWTLASAAEGEVRWCGVRNCIGRSRFCFCFCAENMAGRHTIILMQLSQNRASRTFMDFSSVNHALDGICALYERKIRDINPMARSLTYDITDLYNFIDGLTDISALVYDHSLHGFLPYDRQWMKQKMFQHLKSLAQD